LPLGWNILHSLARLGFPLVERLIAEDRIHPRLTLREANDLLAEHGLCKPRNKKSSRIRQRTAAFVAFVQQNWPNCSDDDRRFIKSELLKLLGLNPTLNLNPNLNRNLNPALNLNSAAS
jgi:hypothetical protein